MKTYYKPWARCKSPEIMRIIKTIDKHMKGLDKDLKSFGYCVVFVYSHRGGVNVFLGKEIKENA